MAGSYNEGKIPAVSTATNAVYYAKFGDSDNDGSSIEKATASCGEAITNAVAQGAAPSNRFTVIGLDSGVYEENIVLPPGVDLNAPNAIITATSGIIIKGTANATCVVGDVIGGAGVTALFDDTSNFIFHANRIIMTDTGKGVHMDGATGSHIHCTTILTEDGFSVRGENGAEFTLGADEAMASGSGNTIELDATSKMYGDVKHTHGTGSGDTLNIEGNLMLFADRLEQTGTGNVWDSAIGSKLRLIIADLGVGSVAELGTVDVIYSNNPAAQLRETVTPAVRVGIGQIFAKSDGEVYFLDSSGNERKLCVDCGNYGNMYQRDNTTETVIDTQDVWVDVGNFVAGETEDVSFDSDTLTTGSEDHVYAIQYNACIDDGTLQTFEFAISINGVIQDESLICTTTPTGARPDSISAGFIKTVPANADVKFSLRNLSSPNNIVVVHSSVSMHKII